MLGDLEQHFFRSVCVRGEVASQVSSSFARRTIVGFQTLVTV